MGLGLVAGLADVMLGGDMRFNGLAIEFRGPLTDLFFGSGEAVALGFVRLYGASNATWSKELWKDLALGVHEAEHSAQAAVLGPLYFPAILGSWGSGWGDDNNIHGPHSWLEQDACAVAGVSSWNCH